MLYYKGPEGIFLFLNRVIINFTLGYRPHLQFLWFLPLPVVSSESFSNFLFFSTSEEITLVFSAITAEPEIAIKVATAKKCSYVFRHFITS